MVLSCVLENILLIVSLLFRYSQFRRTGFGILVDKPCNHEYGMSVYLYHFKKGLCHNLVKFILLGFAKYSL